MSLKRKGNRESADTPGGAVPAGMAIPCFRCGLCCTRYQPPLTTGEAETIARALDLDLDVFLDRYIDDSWFEPGRFLLDTASDACIFLETEPDGPASLCRIHALRPQACRDWQPGLHQRECVEALERDWGITASPSGKLVGPRANRGRFWAFLESLDG